MSEQEEPEASTSTEHDSALDVGSEHFDPLRALYDPNFTVTDTQPKVRYQNLAAFESALNKFGIWQLNKKQKTASQQQKTTGEAYKDSKPGSSTARFDTAPDLTQRRFEPHQMAIVGTARKKHHRNIYTHMEGAEGPLTLLQKCLPDPEDQSAQRLRVRVLLRKEHCVGGSIQGELVAFDKQWNLLLRDATEVWQRRKFKYGDQKICAGTEEEDGSRRLRELGITLPQVEVKSLNRKNVQLKRHLPQILVRGEHVVLVSLMGNEKKE